MTVRHLTLCNSCLHYLGDGTCAAFADGIPDDILRLSGDHRESVPGDHGIVFSPLKTVKAQVNLVEWKKTHGK